MITWSAGVGFKSSDHERFALCRRYNCARWDCVLCRPYSFLSWCYTGYSQRRLLAQHVSLRNCFTRLFTAKIFIATKMYTRDALETDVLFGTTFSATNNLVSRGKGKALETRKQKEFANGVARKIDDTYVIQNKFERNSWNLPRAEIGKIFTGKRCVVYRKNYGNWYLPPYSTEVLDSCYWLAYGRLMVVLSQRIYPQNGAADQNSCFESEREKKSYKSI